MVRLLIALLLVSAFSSTFGVGQVGSGQQYDQSPSTQIEFSQLGLVQRLSPNQSLSKLRMEEVKAPRKIPWIMQGVPGIICLVLLYALRGYQRANRKGNPFYSPFSQKQSKYKGCSNWRAKCYPN